jgi:hypothetical protein
MKETVVFIPDTTSIQAGSFNVFYNSATAVEVEVVGTEDADGVLDLIIASCPASHTATKETAHGAIILEHKTAQANATPMSIVDVDSGITFQKAIEYLGADATSSGGVVPGNISVFYNSATATFVALSGSETLSSDIADKIVLQAPLGYTVSTVGQTISIEKDIVGVNAIPLSISFGSTDVTEEAKTLTLGEDAVSGVTPGNISVFYNISGATLVALDGSELTSSDVADRIVALAPTTYTVANVEGAVSIEKKVAGANTIPLSITFGDTGVSEDSSTLIPGADLIHGGGSAKATVIDLEYSIDTREKLNAGTAKWTKIETNGSASAYKEFIYTHPVSAVRANVTTGASDSTCNWIVKAI